VLWIHPQLPDGTFLYVRLFASHLYATFPSLSAQKAAARVDKLDRIKVILPLGPESVVFLLGVQEYEDVQNCDFVRCFMWVWNLVCHSKGVHGLSVFGNRVLRNVVGPQRGKMPEAGENTVMMSVMFFSPHQILFGWVNERGWDGHGR
jgi:hypothetical protein